MRSFGRKVQHWFQLPEFYPPFVVPSVSVGLVGADHPLLLVAQWLDVALVADLSGLLLAVLDVAVRLGFLGTSFHLELVDFLWLETVDLLLSWEREAVGKLLAIASIWSQSPTLVPTSGVLSPICCSLFFFWLIGADQALLSVTQWLYVALVADLSGLLLAVLDLAVRLGFLGTSPHPELVSLLLARNSRSAP